MINQYFVNFPIVMNSLFSLELKIGRAKLHHILLYKINDEIMHMYCNAKVDTPEYFRAELCHLMSVMRITISQYIHKRCRKRDMGKYPLLLPIYRQIYEILYYSSKPENFFTRDFITMEWQLMTRANNCVCYHIKHLDCRY